MRYPNNYRIFLLKCSSEINSSITMTNNDFWLVECNKDSEEYFNSRPFESKVGAHASVQSTVISSRQILDQRYEDALKKYSPLAAVPRPSTWGGYLLIPERVEFWQGRSNRLHDRLRYVRDKENQNWKIERLMP